ncbi:PorT family protein [Hymenobacter sp. UV11]|uniref:porin family protein n=1 Tax=Hymenobacter sp. UV11 TaxID=1849735 RepID=UPI00105E3360|nr:porin family protein [Hymenobacter sp. UV11]TDN35970.1 hypothetical protein A8B98_11190 [Hymenobacter sp. UV11]TFZ68215.1 PorT family protein [Hymenobacter sp. UV11]
MKKLLLTLAALAVAPAAFAQVEIGLKVSPSIAYLRTSSQSNSFQNGNSKVGFGGGIFVDYFFGENYAFNTGLFLTGKGGTYSYQEPMPAGAKPTTVTHKLGIDYVEVPITIKLFTNEIAPATRLYFQLGPSIAVPVGARINGDKYYTDSYNGNAQTKALDHVFAVDLNVLGSIGAEYQLGQSTKVLAGLSYHHGLVDLDRYFQKDRNFSDVSIKNSVFALDLGLKF